MTVSVLQVSTPFAAVGGSTSIVCNAITVQAGSYLHAYFSYDGSGGNLTSVTSSPSLTWTILDDSSRSASDSQNMAHAVSSVTSAGSITVTGNLGSSQGFRAGAVKEIGGSSGYDSTAGAHNASSQSAPGTGTDALTSGNTPTLTSQPALVSAWSENFSASNGIPNAGTGFTSDYSGSDWGGGPQNRGENKRVTSTSAVAGTYTAVNGGNAYGTVVAVFLEASSGWNTSGTGPRSVPVAGGGPTAAGSSGAFTRSTDSGSGGISGSASFTYDNMTVAGSAALLLQATASITLGAMTVAGTGKVAIAGSGSPTFGALTLSGTGQLAIAGSGAATFSDMTMAGTGALAITASGAATFGDMTLSGSGTLGAPGGISGSLSTTFADMTLSGSGSLALSGSSSISFGAMTVAGTGQLLISAVGTASFGAMTVSGAGSVALRSQGAATFADMTASGTGALRVAGSMSTTLADMTVSGSGSVAVRAQGAITFGDLILSGLGNGPGGGGGPVEVVEARSPMSRVGKMLS